MMMLYYRQWRCLPCSIYLSICISVFVELCFIYLLSRIRQRHECECRAPVAFDVLLTSTGRESGWLELVPHRGPYNRPLSRLCRATSSVSYRGKTLVLHSRLTLYS